MFKIQSIHQLSRRDFLKGLGAAPIIGATLTVSEAEAGVDVGHFGQLVGQCAAIYDLGLMDDSASKAYFKRVYSAWKASSQSTIADFNKSYNRTIETFKRQVRGGNDREDLINLARKIYPAALYNLTSSIPDPSNAAQSILQKQQNAEQAATNQYYSRQYNATQLSQGYGWYVKVMRGYTIESCVRAVQEDTVYQRTPSAILYETEQDAGLYIGPFSTSSEASKFVDSNIQNYGSMAQYIRNEPFTNNGHFRLYWQSGVRLQQQPAKPAGNWYVTIPGAELANTPENVKFMKESLERMPQDQRAKTRIVAIDNNTKITTALGPYTSEEDAKKKQQTWPASLGKSGIFQLPN